MKGSRRSVRVYPSFFSFAFSIIRDESLTDMGFSVSDL